MKSSGIGGQAVLEGIMMRNGNKYAVAVRKPDKEIEIKVTNTKEKNSIFHRLPFVRGIFKFVDSLVIGMKTLTYSAGFYEDEEEVESKVADKVTRKVFREKAENFMMGLTVFISIALAIGIFIILPYYIAEFFKNVASIHSNTMLAVIEGVIRIGIFILYMVLISKMEDIQRTFMYHGAEHKCINCIEHGMELNVENVQKSSRIHKRCGTSFMLFVMFISIICFIIISAVFPENMTRLWKVVIRLLLVPFIAGISFEILRKAGSSDGKLINAISRPGMWLQRLSTREPSDDMVEVAIKAVEAVFDWKQYLKDEFGYVPVEDEKTEDEKGEPQVEDYTDEAGESDEI